MLESVFFQISIIFVITFGAAIVITWLRQPFLIAYIVAGILAGPLLLNLVSEEQELFKVFSQFGVILLLFAVGLSLNFSYIKKISRVAVITGVGQVIFTGVVGTFILLALGFSLSASLWLAVAITFSSTIIITKLLSEKKATETLYGRYTIGLMLVQDIIAIILMIFLTSDKVGSSVFYSIWLLAGKGVLFLGIVVLLAKYVLPKILDKIARSTEFLFIFALAWCFGLTYLASKIGFSLEIGAVMAGLALGSSVYQPEITARVRPLRDFFLIIFFIILGTQMNTGNFVASLGPGIILSLFIIIGNPLILYLLYRWRKFTRRNSFLAGITAAQVSEFGFVLLFVGYELGQITQDNLAVFTFVALVTIFASSYLVTYGEKIFAFLEPFLNKFSKEKYGQKEDNPPLYDIWLIGYHRIGWKICEVLKKKKLSFAIVDFNPEVIAELRAKGIPAYFGDIGNTEFLDNLPFVQAQLIISTIPESESQITLLKHLRPKNKDLKIVVNSAEAKYRDLLYKAGADYVMTPHLLGGSWLAEMIDKKQLNEAIFQKLRQDQKNEITAGLPIHNL